MRLHELEMAGFGPFGSRQRIDFDALGRAGLYLLAGPTGAGKSSILDAVAYALYGRLLGVRENDGEPVSHHRDRAEAPEVRLEATIGGRRVRIHRTPPHKRPKKRGAGETEQQASAQLEELREGQWHPVSTAVKEVDDTLCDWIGMTRDQFCQVVVLPQGEFAAFLRAGARERLDLLRYLFPTHDFRNVEQWLGDRAKDRRRELDEKRTELDLQLSAARAVARGEEPSGEGDGEEPGDTETQGIVPADAGEREPLDTAAAGKDSATGDDGEPVEISEGQPDDTGDDAAVSARAPEQIHPWIEQEARRLSSELEASEAEVARAEHALGEAEGLLRKAEDREQRIGEAARAEEAASATWRDAVERLGSVPEAATLDLARPAAELAGTGGALRQLGNSLRSEVDRLEELEREAAAARERLRKEESEARQVIEAEQAVIAEQDRLLREGPDEEALTQEELNRAIEAEGGLEAARNAVEGAAQRARAAAERDRLAPGVQGAEDEVRRARDRLADARDHLNGVRARRLEGMASELAAGLEAGIACPVCGSTEHPAPAHGDGDAVTTEQEEEARSAVEQLEAELERAREHERQLASERDRLDAEAGSGAAEELEAERQRLDAELRERSELAGRRAGLEQQLAEQRQSRERAAEEKRRAESEVAARQAELDKASKELADWSEREDAQRGDDESVAARRERLQGAVELIDRACEAADEASRAGAARAEAERIEVPVELEEAREGHEAARSAKQEASDRCATARDRKESFERESAPLPGLVSELEPLEQAAAAASELADLTGGRNALRQNLSTYVLAARLEQVIEAANRRLAPMSGGRYTLLYRAEPPSRGRAGGLGISVLDSHTGAERETATLSGGESFYASLSLALGLAEVVQREAGGRRLESLFIDEGFGSLDSETLNDVMAVLDELRDGGRAVGIVSHVEELRERIDARIDVSTGPDGSTVSLSGVA